MYPKKSLRIRKRSGFYEINFKKRISYEKGIHAKNEEEFQVTELKNFLSLIKDFGFRKWLRKEKITELYRIKSNFNIELNYVKKLGWFLELEYLANNKTEIPKAQKEILNLLDKLIVNKKELVKEGYTKALWDKKHQK